MKNSISQHFKNESKIMLIIFLFPIFLGILAIFLVPYLMGSGIDACLDSGGSYDYKNCKCDFSNSHEVIENSTCTSNR